MTDKERKEFEEILQGDLLLACDAIVEKSNYQYIVKIVRWSWENQYSVCIADKIGRTFVDSPLMDETAARDFYNHLVAAFRIA